MTKTKKGARIKRDISFFLSVWGLMFFILINSAGAVPQFVTYQGKISDTAGPFEGILSITFRIYDQEEGSIPPLWEETHSVNVSNGIYTVFLGSGTITPGFGDFNLSLFSGSQRWLEVEINGETMIPRQQVTSVPFSLATEDTDSLGGFTLENFSEAGHGHNFGTITGQATDVQIPDTITISHSSDTDTLSGHSSASFSLANHQHSGNDIVSSTLSTIYIDAALTRDTELSAGLLSKSDTGHQHDIRYDIKTEINSRFSSLDARLAALEEKLNSLAVSAEGKDLTFSGVNIHVESGTGTTNGTINSLGNLIVGYNEKRGTGDDRSGSHTIILGTQNNYSSYGSLIAGYKNTISAPYASVSGGRENIASGWNASVSGGMSNLASASQSSVSGGRYNAASAVYASVSGGNRNTAGYDYASVSGGRYNTADAHASSISGGRYNTASGWDTSINGGYYNIASNDYASVNGGQYNQASGIASSVSGGGGPNPQDGNIAFANYSSILGGLNNLTGEGSLAYDAAVSRNVYSGGTDHTMGQMTTVSGGMRNTAREHYASVSGGLDNIASGYYASINGGKGNTASDNWSSVSGGAGNSAVNWYSSVSGGFYNTADGHYASVSGGAGNDSNGMGTSVSGGSFNTAKYYCDSVSGGIYNQASGELSSISGGGNNVAHQDYSTVSGGDHNEVYGHWSSLTGGTGNTASGDYASVTGGLSAFSFYYTDLHHGDYSAISGGYGNSAEADYASVSGGRTVRSIGEASSISGGLQSRAYSNYSSVSGGYINRASGEYSSVSGGKEREVSGIYDWRGGGVVQGY